MADLTPTDVVIREATVDEIPEILRQRRAMYEDMDFRDPRALDAMIKTTGPYLERALADGGFRAWLASFSGKVIGGGAVVIAGWPGHADNPDCRRATILNVYTYPDFRRRGVARTLMETMLDWCRRERFHAVFLHASKDGRPLYESLGFKPANEMRLELE